MQTPIKIVIDQNPVGVVISIVALAVSIIALALSTRGRRLERERTLRSQLSEVLREYASTLLERSRVTSATDRDRPTPSGVTAVLDQLESFLVQQINYLAEQIPRLVTSVEWCAIGYSNGRSGDFVRADMYYKRGIEASTDAMYKIGAAIAYAWCLYTQRRFEEGRSTYRQHLANLTNNDDFARYQKGRAYMFWGMNECTFAQSETQSKQAFEGAFSEFTGISMKSFRENALKELEKARVDSSPGPSPTEQVVFGQANT